MHPPPHPSAPQPAPSVTSPPSTPSTASRLTLLRANAGASVPTKKVSIKNASGQEVTLDTLKRTPLTTIPLHPPSPTSVKNDINRQSICIESQEKKAKRLAEERTKEGESDDKSKSSDALVRANEATAREVERQESLKEQQRDSGRNRNLNSLSMPPNTRSASIGLGSVSPSMSKSAGSGFQMGQFSTSAGKTSSEEHFLAAGNGRSVSVTGGPTGGRPRTMVRMIRQSDTGHERTRSNCGTADSNVTGNAGPTIPVSVMGPPMEPVTPLERTANRWVAISTRRIPWGVNIDSPEMVDRKVKGLLNKLTMERFDSISDQIIAWANKSERERDGQTLIQVIKLIFEKTTDEAIFSEMYARLCRKMMEQISPKVQDDWIKNAEGKPFAGGQLFRKYLLNRCQEDFERGWVAKGTTAAAAANKAAEDRTHKEANEKTKGGEESESELKLYSDEYFAAAKAERRGLGLIRFIGELFKLRMLTERIMHECIKKLLGNVESPEREEIESLCVLLTTVGSLLDTQKARAHLDVYFSRMRGLTQHKAVNARMVSKLHDVFELRERRWVPRRATASPMTITQVHEAFSKEQRAQKKGWVTGGAGSLQALPTLSEAETKAKIEADTKEFFSIRMLDKAESYFSSLRTEHRHLLVEALVTKSIEMKGQDVVLVSELFVRVRENGLCSPAAFEEGFE